ncbi:MAG: hypothetical protein IPN76_31600 [Saprospiraceae bacterium]|nr:hypothetical protein [Saprospiraceae bacterium]
MAKHFTLLILLCLLSSLTATSSNLPDSTHLLADFVRCCEKEETYIKNSRDEQMEQCNQRMLVVEQQLHSIVVEDNLQKAVLLLLEKDKIKEEIAVIDNDAQVKLAKLRYRKGIELTRLLYEKIMGLDHHFSSMQTTYEIVKLSNPQNYPNFQLNKSALDAKMKKQTGVQMPSLLSENPMAASSFALIGAFFGEGDSKIKEKNLEEIACILDFTLRMTSDLNLIFYETDFLKQSNISLKDECAKLFEEYTKVIGYFVPLEKCRNQDDWETLYGKLDEYMAGMQALYAGTPADIEKAYKKHASLEFPVNLMIEFIHKYTNFIGQGEQYYHKFEVILGNYKNEAVCSKDLPEKFQSVKAEVRSSILKFNEAYNVAELRGSKLKDLLYGWNE